MLYIAFSVNLKKYGFVRSNRTKVLEEVKHILRAHQFFQLCSFLPRRRRKMYESSFIQGPWLVSRELKFTGHNKPYSSRATASWEGILNSGWETIAKPYWMSGAVLKQRRSRYLWLTYIWNISGNRQIWGVTISILFLSFRLYYSQSIPLISHLSSKQHADVAPHFRGPLANSSSSMIGP